MGHLKHRLAAGAYSAFGAGPKGRIYFLFAGVAAGEAEATFGRLMYF
jgi:hypothetical protein